MSSPITALEQHSLLKDRLTIPAYAKYMQPFMEDLHRKNLAAICNPDGKPSGWYFCQREIKRLAMAETYYLSAEMMPLVRWAGAGLNGTDSFSHEVWPSDYGFAYFEEALLSEEIWGRTIVTKAMSWGRAVDPGTGHPGTIIVFYTDMGDARDEVNDYVKVLNEKNAPKQTYDFLKQMGQLHVHHLQWLPDGMRVGPERLIPPEHYADYAVGDQKLAPDATNDMRFVLAFLMLLNQTVVTVSKQEADKRTSKRMRRMKMPTAVTVIQLRRHKSANRQEGESIVEWANRWVVRGHWRNQPYGDGTIKRIFIAPFIKGPEDRPLVMTKKVNALVR